MDLVLPGRRPLLDRWASRPDSPAVAAGPGPRDRRDVYETAVGDEPPGPPITDGPHRRVARAILRYDVFPPGLITPVLARAPVERGDTVGIWLRAGGLFFAARVTEVFDGADGPRWRTGFTYRTLAGHPELGEETFSVEKDLAGGAVRAALRAWSRPGLLLTRLAGPITRRLQVAASHAALEHLRRAARAPA